MRNRKLRWWSPIVRVLGIVVAAVFLTVGLVTFPLPIPIGLPLILVGVAILARSTPPVRNFLRRRFGGSRTVMAALDRLAPEESSSVD